MVGDIFGALFLLLVSLAIIGFVVYRNLFYKGKRRKDVKPDSLEAALLKKEIAEGRLVVDVPDVLVIGK
jgi:hypothetical protein